MAPERNRAKLEIYGHTGSRWGQAGLNVRFWPKADIPTLAPDMSAFGGKADIIQGKADIGNRLCGWRRNRCG
jgi:hypothetical protein